jgi:hypothetical protein
VLWCAVLVCSTKSYCVVTEAAHGKELTACWLRSRGEANPPGVDIRLHPFLDGRDSPALVEVEVWPRTTHRRDVRPTRPREIGVRPFEEQGDDFPPSLLCLIEQCWQTAGA